MSKRTIFSNESIENKRQDIQANDQHETEDELPTKKADIKKTSISRINIKTIYMSIQVERTRPG